MSNTKQGGAMARRKGSSFELYVAKKLSEWSGLELRRTPLSGGWGAATTLGDIVPIAPDQKDQQYGAKQEKFARWNFSVECKAQEGWSLDTFVQSPKTCKLTQFIEQATKAAREGRNSAGGALIPVVIAKRNNRKPIILMPLRHYLCMTYHEQPLFSVYVNGTLFAGAIFEDFLRDVVYETATGFRPIEEVADE